MENSRFNFKTLTFAILLTTCTFGSDIQITESPKVEIGVQLREQFKDFFVGETGKYVLEDTSLFELNDELDISFPSTQEKKEACIAYAGKVQAYLSSLTFDGKEELLENLAVSVRRNKISPLSLSIFILKAQALQSSNISSYERDFFDHLSPLGQLMNLSLMDSDASFSDLILTGRNLKSALKHNPHASNVNIFTHQYPSIQNISHEVFSRFHEEIESRLSPRTFFPVLGKGFLGYHYLIENLIHKRYPIAVPKPSSSLSAHGIKEMSPLGFTIHDIAHIILDGRMHFLSEYGAGLLKELIESGIHYKKASPIVIERVVAEDALLTQTLASFLKNLDEAVVSGTIEEITYKKSLYGFFFMMHEVPHFFSLLLKTPTLPEIFQKVKIITVGSQNSAMSFNPLTTSHKTGESPFEDFEIQKRLFTYFEEFKPFMLNSSSIYPDISNETFRTDNIDEFEVKRSSFSVDLTVTLKSGEKVYFAIPTLYQTYTNTMHSLKPLDTIETIEGIGLDPSTRKDALSNMKRVQDRISNDIATFWEVTGQLSGEGEKSLNNNYAESFSEIAQTFEEKKKALEPLPETLTITDTYNIENSKLSDHINIINNGTISGSNMTINPKKTFVNNGNIYGTTVTIDTDHIDFGTGTIYANTELKIRVKSYSGELKHTGGGKLQVRVNHVLTPIQNHAPVRTETDAAKILRLEAELLALKTASNS